MSFILDALKKVERDQREGASRSFETMAASRGRLGSGRHLLSMAVIAVVSAAATAALVSLLSSRGATDGGTGGSETGASERQPPLATLETAPATVAAGSEAPTRDRNEAASAPTHTGTESATPTPEARVPVETPEPDPFPVSVQEPTESVDAPVQAIRLVGRERVMLGGVGADELESGDGGDEEPHDPLPPDFPKLVLQGTSVIGGSSVAVISDQRVFVGDRIEGALVIRIDEREVELEIDGRRFTLRL